MGATCLIDSFIEIYSAVNELKPGRTMVYKVKIMTIRVALAGSYPQALKKRRVNNGNLNIEI